MRDAPKSHLVTENAGPAKLQGRTAVHLDAPAADRQRRNRELKTSEMRYRRLFETAPYGILVLDAETGVVIDVNPATCRLLGYQQKEILEHPLWSLPAFKSAAAAKNQFRELLDRTHIRYDELPLEAKDGQIRRVEFVCTPFGVDNKQFVQCMLHDVTDRLKREQEEVARAEQADLAATFNASQSAGQATHDETTGLVNRCYLDEILPRELHRAERAAQPLTVTVLGLDGVQAITEQSGQDAADAMLKEVGRVIREHLRKSDTACRYTADEFVLVLPQSTTKATHTRIDQIRRALRSLEVQHGKHLLSGLTLSAGIATLGPDGRTPQELLRAAHTALVAGREAPFTGENK
jgi:diguanylate cyclase (GGDEF)-like protein/PAS domain S-box-containing protein